jgi:hypothetical protein
MRVLHLLLVAILALPARPYGTTCLRTDLLYHQGSVEVAGPLAGPGLGNCGFNSPPSARAHRHWVTVSKKDRNGWQDGARCGSCVQFTSTAGKQMVGYIYDSNFAPKYTWGLSSALYRELTGESAPGRKSIKSAEVVECPTSLVPGPLRLRPKPGSHAWWAAWQVTNARLPVRGLSLSTDGGATWLVLEGPGPPAPTGFWFIKPTGLTLDLAYALRVESDSGQVEVQMGKVRDGEVAAATNNQC